MPWMKKIFIGLLLLAVFYFLGMWWISTVTFSYDARNLLTGDTATFDDLKKKWSKPTQKFYLHDANYWGGSIFNGLVVIGTLYFGSSVFVTKVLAKDEPESSDNI